MSSKFCEELDAQLRTAGISTVPDLLDPTIDRRTRIYLFDADRRPPGIQDSGGLFNAEEDLSYFLQKQFRISPAIKRLGLRLLGTEEALGPGCRIDIPPEDKKTKALVGIELKLVPQKDVWPPKRAVTWPP